jgi:hypothetical protein
VCVTPAWVCALGFGVLVAPAATTEETPPKQLGDAQAAAAALLKMADPNAAVAEVEGSFRQLRRSLFNDEPYAQALRAMAEQIQRARDQASRHHQAAVEARRLVVAVQLQLADLERRVGLLEGRSGSGSTTTATPGSKADTSASAVRISVADELQARVGTTEDGLATVSAQGRAVARSNSRLKSRIEHVEWLQNQTRCELHAPLCVRWLGGLRS